MMLSVRPAFAEAILHGEKQFELRRTRPAEAHAGMPVLLYATTPVASIVGLCFLEALVEDTRDGLWKVVSGGAGVSRREFDRYFTGAKQAIAFQLGRPRRVVSSVRLVHIQRARPDFHPPRTFHYVNVHGLNGQGCPKLSVSCATGVRLRFTVS